MKQQLKPSIKLFLQIIYGIIVFNALATLGYTLTNLAYNHLAFDNNIGFVCLFSNLLWIAFTWMNKRFKLEL
jgi:acyl-[acyl carrier protein]--UDP-N-acetylglucosamine O-acyltransferase